MEILRNLKSFLSFQFDLSTGSSFSYDDLLPNGPSNWYKEYPECRGVRQSPINIDTRLVQKANYCNLLNIFNLNVPSTSLFLSNNGHGASIAFEFEKGILVHSYGGPLSEPFRLYNFHLHWPSEHTLNGKRLDAEIHLLHYNEKYGSFEAAAAKPDGLAVLAFFFELVNATTPSKRNNYIKLLETVRLPMREDRIVDASKMITIYDIIGVEPINVYNYQGSLTTPPCSQNVNWMIASRSLKISSKELTLLQKVEYDDGHKIKDNFRPIQALNGRRFLLY